MKRSRNGGPVMMVHRWNRPSQSCLTCREKKRRCDRSQPCSNCTLRNIKCEYSDQGNVDEELDGEQTSHASASAPYTAPSQPASASPATTPRSESSSVNSDALSRLRILEEAVFGKSRQSSPAAPAQPAQDARQVSVSNLLGYTRSRYDLAVFSAANVTARLPSVWQAKILFDHFVRSCQPASGVLHIPSARTLMDETYAKIQQGIDVDLASTLLLLGIFTGSALAWTSSLLAKLNFSQPQIKAASDEYARLAMSIVDNAQSALKPSTTALVALSNFANMLTNVDGFSTNVRTLHFHCVSMARELQVHRLDTKKSIDERRRKGSNMIELEIQRRVWWQMVAGDWLGAFAGTAQDGAYTFHPQHMKVNYPANVDDEFITPTEVQSEPFSSTPTAMSGFICRVKMGEICRQIVDRIPDILLDNAEPDYDLVLEFDKKLQDHLEELPWFFRLDSERSTEFEAICKERHYIGMQRITVNFSIHARICRLHRFYHLEGSTNPKYAYSRTMCLRSAHKILEMRRMMNRAGEEACIKPTRFWKIMQHLFLATVTLATDVSINPEAPGAEERKAKVIATYEVLQRSQEESSVLRDTIHKNIQTLTAILQSKRPPRRVAEATHQQQGTQRVTLPGRRREEISGLDDGTAGVIPEDPTTSSGMGANFAGISDHTDGDFWRIGQEDQDMEIWTDFLAAAPDLEGVDWGQLLDNIDPWA